MVKSVDTRDLKQFEPPRGNARSETRQIRRTPPAPCPANAEPSLPAQEGVESRRRAPKAARPGRRRAPAHERRLFPARKAAGGESRSGKKIPGRKACRFDSGLRHHKPNLVCQKIICSQLLHVLAEHARRPIDQTAPVVAIGKEGLQTLKAHEQPHQQSPGPYPVLNASAECSTTASSRPIVSAAIWRLRPLTLLPASYPRFPRRSGSIESQ